MSSEPHPPCIVVTGMHRSATSAAAAALQSAGVHMGDLLFGANEGNPRGYYEDADFVLLHEDALKGLGLSKEGWVVGQTCEFRDPVRARAKELVDRRRQRNVPWGWKDPRTVLFLDEWSALLPEAHYIFAFRAPWEVLDSLYRRRNPGDEVFEVSPELAAEVYASYARLMLDFARKRAGDVLFVTARDILTRPREWIATAKTKWNLALGEYDSALLDPKGLKGENGEYRKRLLAHYFPTTITVYRELLAAAGKPEEEVEGGSREAFAKWALQDWVALRRAQRLLKKADEENDRLRQQVAAVVQERDEWRGRASDWETRYRRFRRWVESSVFWRMRSAVLNMLSRVGLRVHVHFQDEP